MKKAGYLTRSLRGNEIVIMTHDAKSTQKRMCMEPIATEAKEAR
jgi:hypothetical protein